MKQSLALCCIAKNEESNVKRFLESFLPVVDHIYFVDTGSTDKTVEIAKEVGGDKITIRHFEWIQDFAAARNESIKDVKEDYFIWSDLDDVLLNPQEFISWKNSVMYMSDVWVATYDYAQHADGKSACSFVRERVFRNNRALKFQYFVHEGILTNSPGMIVQHVPSWKIQHQRSIEDITKDKGRNLGIFKFHEQNGTPFDARMRYYFGKEYHEAGDHENALKEIGKAISTSELEHHDRVLAIQYFCISLFKIEKIAECIDMAKQGLALAPTRAEFYVLQGDCYMKMGKILEALPCYAAAAACHMPNLGNGAPTVIFSHDQAYGPYPLCQMARGNFHLQRFDESQRNCDEAIAKYDSEEAKLLLAELNRVRNNVFSFKNAQPVEDIVFTCLGGMYEWDSKIYKERSVGGSETSTIFLAKYIKQKTGRRVIVFNPRKEDYIDEDGVEYRKVDGAQSYFGMNKPHAHFAWRHNVKLTDAKTYIISHDIYTQGMERLDDYEKYICLSGFHKNYINTIYNVPENKIVVSRNGIPEFYKDFVKVPKNPNKMLYVSSWDRGLDRCINVLDLVRLEYPDLELHIFYGCENMIKSGGQMAELAERLNKMIEVRPWIKNHGAVKQSELKDHYADAALLVYPLNFIESFCISLLEVLACGVYPIARGFGAITSTLGPFAEQGMGTIMPFDAVTVDEVIQWSDVVKSSIKAKVWEKVDFNYETHSWQSVADEFIFQFDLGTS